MTDVSQCKGQEEIAPKEQEAVKTVVMEEDTKEEPLVFCLRSEEEHLDEQKREQQECKELKQLMKSFQCVTEGKGTLWAPKQNKVFYNPAMVNNRDLSVAVLRWFSKQRQKEREEGIPTRVRPGKHNLLMVKPIPHDQKVQGLRVLEGLAASGLRSIRYVKEVENIGRVDAVDLDETAVASIELNVKHNKVQDKVIPCQNDARMIMLERTGWYDVVDLDPYGSPVNLLDSAVQAINEGGLLMVTATDMSVLCGNSPEACYSKYAAFPLSKSYQHEQALRILLYAIQQHAARYKRYIVPVVSVSMDFWVRVFVRIYTSADEVKKIPVKTSYIYQVTGCEGFVLHPIAREGIKNNRRKFQVNYGPPVPQTCPETKQRYQIGGPIWSDPIHDQEAVKEIMQDVESTVNDPQMFPVRDKVMSTLRNISEELVDVPLFYDLHVLSAMLKMCAIKAILFKSALLNAGYRVSNSHACKTAVKTDAPLKVVLDIMRCWYLEQNHGKLTTGTDTVREIIFSKMPELQANFSKARGSVSKSQAQNKVRFVQNPARWGPRRRHGKRPFEWEEGGQNSDQKRINQSHNGVHQQQQQQNNDEPVDADVNDEEIDIDMNESDEVQNEGDDMQAENGVQSVEQENMQ